MRIVFICIDCLREDILRSERTITPTFDALIEESSYFTNMFSTTSTTTPSVASFMTGKYSENNGVNSLQECQLLPTVTTLAEKLSSNDWRTAAKVTGPLAQETGLGQGFDKFQYRRPTESVYSNWGNKLVKYIEKMEDKSFLYVHLWELHEPIEISPKCDEHKYGGLRYERALAGIDSFLEGVIDCINEDDLLVIHGDHGESITWRESVIQGFLRGKRDKIRFDWGINTRRIEQLTNRVMQRFSPKINDHFLERAHGSTIHDFMTNVPLLLYGPDIPQETITAQCRQVDVFPTLLEYLDIPFDIAVDGSSLFPFDNIDDRPAYIRACGTVLQGKRNWSRGIRYDDKKYIEYPNNKWTSELYDLSEDPMELYASNDEEAMKQFRELMPDFRLQNTEKEQVDDLLESLGYL